MSLIETSSVVPYTIVIPKGVRSARFLQRASSPEGPCVFDGMEKVAYVYMMSSSSRRALYTGITTRLRSRVFEHKKGLVEGFSSKYKCHRLVYFEQFENIVAAIAREKEIKGWRREKKDRLVESINPDWKDLAADWFVEELLFQGKPMNAAGKAQGPSPAARDDELSK